jgi:hypothetical protein
MIAFPEADSAVYDECTMQPRKPTLAEIGRGAYSLSEAAKYTEVPLGTVRA